MYFLLASPPHTCRKSRCASTATSCIEYPSDDGVLCCARPVRLNPGFAVARNARPHPARRRNSRRVGNEQSEIFGRSLVKLLKSRGDFLTLEQSLRSLSVSHSKARPACSEISDRSRPAVA